jgi:hypothetical protein
VQLNLSRIEADAFDPDIWIAAVRGTGCADDFRRAELALINWYWCRHPPCPMLPQCFCRVELKDSISVRDWNLTSRRGRISLDGLRLQPPQSMNTGLSGANSLS